MPGVYNREVSYDEFCQRVRRHPPSSLVPLAAQLAARYHEPGSWLKSPYKKFTPWALAEVQRVSLVYGNERRGLPATENDLLRCCAAHVSLRDRDLSKLTIDGFMRFMLRLSHEQMPYQHQPLNELSRSIALFVQTPVARPLEVLVGSWAQDLLGCSVEDYVAVAFLLFAAATNSSASFNLAWLDQQNFSWIAQYLPITTVREVVSKNFVGSVDWIRDSHRALPSVRDPQVRRYLFNPLYSKPLVDGVGTDLVVSVPGLVIRKASPLGIYYAGTAKWGDAFARDVGYLFEAYVGRLLRIASGMEVLPTVTYYDGKDRRESVDWIVVSDEAVILVEVKSTRPTEAVRAGDDHAVNDLQIRLRRAGKQISATLTQIERGNPAFAGVPKDRPFIGLIVTMEPFYVINAPMYRDHLVDSVIPVRFCSSIELEQLVTRHTSSLGQFMAEFVSDPSRDDWAIASAIEQEVGTFDRNSVIDAAWDAMPWADSRRRSSGHPNSGRS